MDKKTSKSKGFAFVEMPKVGEAKDAMQALNGTTIGDNKLRVKKAGYRSENQD
jgi:RNA recognition motif-containing protein